MSPTPEVPMPGRRALVAAWAAALAGGARADLAEQAVSQEIEAEGARLELHFEPGIPAALRAEALLWVRRSAAAVARYFGRFPVSRARLVMQPVDGAGVRGGTTFSDPAPWIRIRLGRDTSRAQLLADWILVHEMNHLAVPQLPRAQTWLHEGIATYVEGVARGRARLVAPAEVWAEWWRDMPQGLPQPGDRGLDHTPTWGRTYWGGASFCLLADLRIHQRSGLRLGLQHALQGVLAASGNYGVAWPLQRILATADAAVGQATLGELYAAMKARPEAVDLPALWRDLGVSASGLRDDAPWAAVRRAILA